jgi:hypothetical protein
MRFALLSCAAALAAGCADLEWRKEGVDAATLARDLDECQHTARTLAKRQTPPPGYDAPRVVGVDAENRVIVSNTPGRVDSDRFLVEHDLTRQCMDSRGYQLAPAPKR